MNKFLKYIEDDKFIKWVYNEDEELNSYWLDYIRRNPEKRKEIEAASLILRELKPKQDNISREEILKLQDSILQKLDGSQQQYSSRNILFTVFKYAAAVIIIITLGTLGLFKYNIIQLAKNTPPSFQIEDEAKLILSDGNKINLIGDESKIEYNVEGKLVVNQKDTVNNLTKISPGESNQLIIPYGKSSSVKLSDGTQVYLNAGSMLSYPTVFTGKTREVFLTGEAYFEVAHDSHKPFDVVTKELVIRAVGTSFNVSAYKEDLNIETILLEGKVIIRENAFKLRKNEIVLKPNEMALFRKESLETQIKNVNVEDYTAWRFGYLNFQNEDITRVVARIERYYNIKLVISNEEILSQQISGKLVLKENKEKVLEVLAKTSKVNLYKLDDSRYELK